MKKLTALVLSIAVLFAFASCKSGGSDEEYFRPEDTETEISEVSESETEKEENPVISAYLDYINSYVWVYYLVPEDLPEDKNYENYEWGSYYFYDFESDGTPELIMIVGTNLSSASCLVFKYESGAVSNVGTVPCAYGVGVAYIEGSPTIVLCEFQGEYENFTAVTLEMESLYTASSIPVLPEGSVPMEPTGIGTDYSITVPDVPEESEETNEENSSGENWADYHPNENLFLETAKDKYRYDYDCSGMYVADFWVDEDYYQAHCVVFLPIEHEYALETFVVEVISNYLQSEDRWTQPNVISGISYMDWKENILGTWVLTGEGLFGGEEHIVFELLSVGEISVNCSFGIGTVENTFGEISYSEKFGGGEINIEGPNTVFGTTNCWHLKQGRTKHEFYLHPDIGIYYRSGASSNVFLQEMTEAK